MLIKGQKTSEYVIGDPIGKGAFSYVFKAFHETENRTVAVKLCLPGLKKDDIDRFHRENEILIKLSPFQSPHKRVVTPFTKVISEGSDLFYFMEFSETGHLGKALNKRPDLSFKEKIEIFRKICEGIQYVHSKGVVHRDLWWENVLAFLREGAFEPKLVDFGRAKDFNGEPSLYPPQSLPVKPEITPPENIFRIFDATELENYYLADVYALGLILYFLLETPPLFYINILVTDIRDFLINKGVIELSSLNITERKKLYDEWLENANQKQIENNLRIKLADPNQEAIINKLLVKLSNLDYRKRYVCVDDILKDLSSL